MKRVVVLSIVFLLVSAFALFFAGCKKKVEGPVVIGMQGPITGAWAYEGQMAKQACLIAAKLINERGGILDGRMVEMRIEDDAGEPKGGALAATKLVGYEEVVGSVSTYGSSIFFRTCGRDDSEGDFFASEVPKKFAAAKVAIMHDNTAFGKGLAEDARRAMKPMLDSGALELVFFDAITPGEKDFKVPLTKLRETRPDVWYFTGYYAEAALLVTQARDIGINCPFVGGNAAINDEFVKIAGLEVAKGCYMTTEPMPTDLTTPMAEEFLAAYNSEYGEIPSSPWPIYAADAVNAIAYAIDKSGSTDSKVIAEYMRNDMVEVPGITGKVGFTEIGDREGVTKVLYIVDEGGNIVFAD